jgi:membrane associated rhomboid family serine protease
MKLSLLIHVLAGALVVAGAFACAIRLFSISSGKQDSKPCIISILIIGGTAVITGLQFVFPDVLNEFRRNWEALRQGEWWRMLTPMLVQAEGWKQCCFNGVSALLFCPLAEKLYGKGILALYFISGFVGEIFGYLWSPNGAGSSVGIAGVVGGLFTFACLQRQETHHLTRLLSITGLCAAIVLCLSRDVHGPPIITGALLGYLLAPTDMKKLKSRS